MRKQIVKWMTVEKLSQELITAKWRQEYGDLVVLDVMRRSTHRQ